MLRVSGEGLEICKHDCDRIKLSRFDLSLLFEFFGRLGRKDIEQEKVIFKAGADSKLVQGLMGILTIALKDISPSQALELTPEFANDLGVLNSLSPSRSNGFRNMFDKVMMEIEQMM